MEKYIEVATSLPVDRTFQYKITGNEKYPPEIGKRVHIPFRESKRVGYIVKLENTPMVENPKSVIDIIDEEPVFSGEMITLAEWVKNNYYCSWGEALESMLPGALKRGKISTSPRIKEEEEVVEKTLPHEPNEEQAEVLKDILRCIGEKRHEVFLLHGITGSGKTEVYLQAMERVLAEGKEGVVLVPEIALTPQTVERFKSRFGDKVAVFHSKMLQSMKFVEWKRIKDGFAKVVVGPRSAVFSPFKNPGLFIVDEEHEPSYKQEDVPRYHAREVAIERARLSGAPVILGSATPSLESYYNAVDGKYSLVEITKRVEDKELPRVKIVDMRMDFETRTGKRVISRILAEALTKDIAEKKQALIFLNRRGFSTFLMCRKCGWVYKCGKCDSPMVFHREKNTLICHYCNLRAIPPQICPECKDDYMIYRGAGTQKVEEELKTILPNARIVRMDSDTVSKRGMHGKILSEFKKHNIDIIVGTQMIAKGLDFPKVTLVGVISADANLNLPDFRAGERTFNLITQVAGRAGRGDLGGEVVVQTFTPEHYSVSFSAKHDFKRFYLKEIESRRELKFPPFVTLVKITLRGEIEDNVAKTAELMAKTLLKKMPGLDILGPAPSPMPKLRGYFRWNILVKGKNREEIVRDLRKALKGARKKAGVMVAIDVDPMNM